MRTSSTLRVQILSISHIFWEILAKSYVVAPTSGKSWIRHNCVNLLYWKLFCRKLHENERIWTPREGGGDASLAPPSYPESANAIEAIYLLDPEEGGVPRTPSLHILDPRMPLFFYKRLYIVNLDPEGAVRPCPPTHTHTYPDPEMLLFSLYCQLGSATERE